MDKLNFDKKNLRKFAVTMGVAFLVIAGIVFLKSGRIPLSVAALSALFFILGASAPAVLKPVYILWMKLALVLSWVNTRIILLAIFYLVFTPMGILMRLFGRDPLERRIDKDRKSYWHKKEEKDLGILDYQRQF